MVISLRTQPSCATCRRHGFHPYQSEMNPFNPLNCIEYAFVHTDARGNVLREAQASQGS